MIRNNKKSQGLPINAIILAALALIVLVVVAAIFTGRARVFSASFDDCKAKQGRCAEKSKGCNSNEAEVNLKCPNEKKEICCLKVFGQ
ncbi:hypothetical protein HYX02_07905 [Candidatus Woesearchaeota archaeon]|nr:hypothetical protein [Candidatus Woesearchaeota archaeon]